MFDRLYSKHKNTIYILYISIYRRTKLKRLQKKCKDLKFDNCSLLRTFAHMISLIIPYYKKQSYLKLILESLRQQVYTDFEVIVAEDDNCEATREFIRTFSSTVRYRIIHLEQPKDDGFRKAEMLNKAIRAASGGIIVFLDGDCIPHPSFLKQYSTLSEKGKILFGRRVMLSKTLSDELTATSDLKLLSVANFFRYKCDRKKYAFYLPFLKPKESLKRGIWGCNWGCLKSTLTDVNGFDEDYIRAGVGEDVDIEWRLKKNNCRFFYAPQLVLVYHLYHDANYSVADVNFNLELCRKKQELGVIACRNGLEKR